MNNPRLSVQRKNPNPTRSLFADEEASSPQVPEEPPVLSVAELDRRLQRLVEGATADVRVEGEISGLKVHSSGHAYFTLKDESENACLECVMYRTASARSRRLLEDGARVVLHGKATVYVPRGRLQLIADGASPAGRGALLEAFERLKARLLEEGLFEPERKRPLPADPKVIGVITSADGAAIHDIIKVARRRGPVRIILAPAPVQGPTAAARIAQTLSVLQTVPEVEVIIIGRGGGSADDLSAYNEEILVRAVAQARLPIVSAVGHEIDVTLMDLVADARAATPSQAAEMLVADAAARRMQLEHLRTRMRRALRHKLDAAHTVLDRKLASLTSPLRRIEEERQQIDEYVARLNTHMERSLARRRNELTRIERDLASRHPSAVIAEARASLKPLSIRLSAAMRRLLDTRGNQLSDAGARLNALSPLSVLGRGYSIATDENGRAIRSSGDVQPGARLKLRLHRGALLATVTGLLPPGTPDKDA